MSTNRFNRIALGIAFAILVVTVAFLGVQIERGIEHNLRATCSVMAGQTVILELAVADAVAADVMEPDEAVRINDRAIFEFAALCGDVDRNQDGKLDPL